MPVHARCSTHSSKPPPPSRTPPPTADMTKFVRALAVLCVVASVGCATAIEKPPSAAALAAPVSSSDTALVRILHTAVRGDWTLRIGLADSVLVTGRAVDLTTSALVLVGRRIPLADIRK